MQPTLDVSSAETANLDCFGPIIESQSLKR